MMDETPYQDETLTPIRNIQIVNDKYFHFDAFFKGNETHFELDCSPYEGAIDVVLLLSLINLSGYSFNTTFDEIDIFFDGKNLSIKLGKNDNENRILFDFNEYGNTFCLRFPEPTKEYEIGNSKLENNITKINCIGTNLDDEEDTAEGYYYEWRLNLPDEIQPVINKLLSIGLK